MYTNWEERRKLTERKNQVIQRIRERRANLANLSAETIQWGWEAEEKYEKDIIWEVYAKNGFQRDWAHYNELLDWAIDWLWVK